MKVEIETEVYPSEDKEKVMQAVKNIFPSIELKSKKRWMKGESSGIESLENLKNKLGLQAIRDSARGELRKNISDKIIKFSLNKQAATVDKVSFSYGEAPLGSIDVKIEAENPHEVLNYLAPGQKNRKG